MVAQVVSKGRKGVSKISKTPVYTQKAYTQKAAIAPKVVAEISSAPKSYLSYAERSRFYTCQDRKTLRDSAIARIKELEDMNDRLQRELAKHEDELKNSPEDVPFILATIEHKKAMIARNTGEVIKVYIQDEERQQRISELDATNRRLEKEMAEKQHQWEHAHDQQTRIQVSSILLLNREKIDKNLAELADLKRNF